MYRKIVLSGVAAAAVLGAGGTALAVSGSDVTAGTPSTASHSTAKPGKHAGKAMRRVLHGEFVTRGKKGTYVTHELIRGTITAVSATSITVKSVDGTAETFTVAKATKVRQRANGKATTSRISSVHTGDHAFVTGTGTGTPTAKRVIVHPAS